MSVVVKAENDILCESTLPYIDKTTVDFACPTQESATSIVISGNHVMKLCSVDVSLGRNVALRGETTQSSTMKVWVSENAVDGDIGPMDDQDGQSLTCTHTDVEEWPHFWELKLDTEVELLRVDIFNRVNRESLCCEDRLRGFTLTAFKGDLLVYTYRDVSHDAQEKYHVTPQRKLQQTVDKIRIESRQTSQVLTLCEVKVFA
ncbi:hypothetical protein EGW08_023599, partial [Elysia chlorotica]